MEFAPIIPPFPNFAVGLHPDMEQLASSAFMEVARHLPSMLRQWYLTVDRQTSAIVNK